MKIFNKINKAQTTRDRKPEVKELDVKDIDLRKYRNTQLLELKSLVKTELDRRWYSKHANS